MLNLVNSYSAYVDLHYANPLDVETLKLNINKLAKIVNTILNFVSEGIYNQKINDDQENSILETNKILETESYEYPEKSFLMETNLENSEN